MGRPAKGRDSMRPDESGTWRVCKRFKFEAAHILDHATTKACVENIHGHSYKVDVVVKTEELHQDMVLDFGDLKTVVAEYLEHWDHALLVSEHKDVTVLRSMQRKLQVLRTSPTAERMAEHLFVVFSLALKKKTGLKVRLESVRVWETEDSWAEFQGVE